MVDSLRLPGTGIRVVDSNGKPIELGTTRIDDAGTSNLKAVFLDAALTSAADNPIAHDGSGYAPVRYIGTGNYKRTVKDQSGTDVMPVEDNLPGALDTSGFTANEAIPIHPTVPITSNLTVDASHKGKMILADPTGGDISVTLGSAVTLGDDFSVTIKHVGSANKVTVSTTGGQLIDNATEFVLNVRNEAISPNSDGGNWHIRDDGRLVADTPLPKDYIGGLQVSSGADALHDITNAIGEARDAADTVNLTLAAPMTKRIDASWAAGTGNGGLADNGGAVTLSPDTWYHNFLVDTSSGATDAGFDTSTTAVNLLADTGGSKYVRTASIKTDASQDISIIIQHDDKQFLSIPQATTTGTIIDFQKLVPTGLALTIRRVEIYLDEVSLDGSGNLQVQIGDSGGIEATGYTSGSDTVATITTGFLVKTGASTRQAIGTMILDLSNTSTNLWTGFHNVLAASGNNYSGGGRKALSGALDRLRLTVTANNLDGGAVNVRVEFE